MRYKFEDLTQKRNSQSIDFNVLFCVEDALKRGELDPATDKRIRSKADPLSLYSLLYPEIQMFGAICSIGHWKWASSIFGMLFSQARQSVAVASRAEIWKTIVEVVKFERGKKGMGRKIRRVAVAVQTDRNWTWSAATLRRPEAQWLRCSSKD